MSPPKPTGTEFAQYFDHVSVLERNTKQRYERDLIGRGMPQPYKHII